MPLALVARDHLLQLFAARSPVDLFLLEFDLAAHAANAELVEGDRIDGFFGQTSGASFHA
jgi:hypothetical protein